jgi:putative selenium metabolism protein SsnA
MSLLLTGGTLVTSVDPARVSHGDLLVVECRIAAIGDEVATACHALPEPPVHLDCTGCLVIPGNVSAHTHAYSALARGMPYQLDPPRSFLEILQRVWWRLDRALDESSIRAAALVAGREALLAGTTTLFDHHASPNAIDGSLDIVAQALGELGIRAVCAYEVTDRDGPERARAGIEENRRFLARVARGNLPLARGMVGAHASFTLGAGTLAEVAELVRISGAGIHIHVAEDAVDESDAMARFGRRVVERLAHAGVLDQRSLLAHAVHLDRDEVGLLRAAAATVAHNPQSNMHNGVGRPPLAALGRSVALGSDGMGDDLFEEGRAAYIRGREDDLGFSPEHPLRMLARGATLAGRLFDEPELGRLVTGAPADLVVIDYAAPTPLDAASLAGHWVFGLSAARVRDVLVAGEPVVRDRRLVRMDEGEIAERARVQAGQLWERLEELDPHPFEPCPMPASVMGGA